MRENFKVQGLDFFGTRDQDLGKGVVRLHNRYEGLLGIKRGSLVKITAREGKNKGQSVICIYRGGVGKDVGRKAMGIEYDYRRVLGVGREGSEIDLEISRAGLLYWFVYLKDHPDPTVKAQFVCASWLTMVGVIIGLWATFAMS